MNNSLFLLLLFFLFLSSLHSSRLSFAAFAKSQHRLTDWIKRQWTIIMHHAYAWSTDHASQNEEKSGRKRFNDSKTFAICNQPNNESFACRRRALAIAKLKCELMYVNWAEETGIQAKLCKCTSALAWICTMIYICLSWWPLEPCKRYTSLTDIFWLSTSEALHCLCLIGNALTRRRNGQRGPFAMIITKRRTHSIWPKRTKREFRSIWIHCALNFECKIRLISEFTLFAYNWILITSCGGHKLSEYRRRKNSA